MRLARAAVVKVKALRCVGLTFIGEEEVPYDNATRSARVAPAPDDVARPRRVRLGSGGAGSSGEAGFDPACAICFSEFARGDDVGQLPCGHAFHTACIDVWLSQKPLCPFRCPQLVFPQLASQQEEPLAQEHTSVPGVPVED